MNDAGLQSLTDRELANLIVSRAQRFTGCAESITHQPLDTVGKFRHMIRAVDEMEARINVPLKEKHKRVVRGREYIRV